MSFQANKWCFWEVDDDWMNENSWFWWLNHFNLLPHFTCFHRLGPAGPTVGSHLSEPTIMWHVWFFDEERILNMSKCLHNETKTYTIEGSWLHVTLSNEFVEVNKTAFYPTLILLTQVNRLFHGHAIHHTRYIHWSSWRFSTKSIKPITQV
jgi:hypothetical protein